MPGLNGFETYLSGRADIVALDIIEYDSTSNRIGYLEFTWELHHAIFFETALWSSYLYLRKLKEYYSSAYFKGNEIKELVDDLERYKLFIDKQHVVEYNALINFLKSDNVEKVAFEAD